MDKCNVIKQIGKGSFSNVYLCKRPLINSSLLILNGIWNGNDEDDNYVIKDCLGQGAFGSVLLICDKNKTSDCKALKVVKIKKREQLTDFLDEIKYGRLFSKYGLGPEIFDTLLLNRPNGKKLGIIVMEKIDITLEKFLRDEQTSHNNCSWARLSKFRVVKPQLNTCSISSRFKLVPLYIMLSGANPALNPK